MSSIGYIPLSAIQRVPAQTDKGEIPLDRFGRGLRDLRISVTDRCNFRCSYCMPREAFGSDHAFLPREALLSFEEIAQLAQVFVGLGVQKIRITGGEPLLRKHLDRLIAMLAALPGIEITLTTNGALLARHASALRDAGLHRLTISLDSLDDAVFRTMNDADFPVADVLRGIEAATAAGFDNIKINMVVKRGINDAGIVDMAQHFRGSGHTLRFIEYMDVGESNGWKMDEVVPAREIVQRLGDVYPLSAVDRSYTGEVAERWQYQDGQGEIGVIASVTQAFCRDCTRLRLSPEGKLFTCLFASQGHDLKNRLRRGDDAAALSSWIAQVWRARQDRYSELRGLDEAPHNKIEMSYIGG